MRSALEAGHSWFSLVKALGLTLSQGLLAIADEVIE
jgi:hypothetical protein